jgi:hypothetical protein
MHILSDANGLPPRRHLGRQHPRQRRSEAHDRGSPSETRPPPRPVLQAPATTRSGRESPTAGEPDAGPLGEPGRERVRLPIGKEVYRPTCLDVNKRSSVDTARALGVRVHADHADYCGSGVRKLGDQPQQGVPAHRNIEGIRHQGAGRDPEHEDRGRRARDRARQRRQGVKQSGTAKAGGARGVGSTGLRAGTVEVLLIRRRCGPSAGPSSSSQAGRAWCPGPPFGGHRA